jgi:tryptophan-rich sensory protein
MQQKPALTHARSVAALGMIIALVALSASFGARFAPGEWYESLNKPWWTPHKGVFAPVWTLLYASIAAAAWIVWRRVGWRHASMLAFALQLVLNALWSYLFFGLHRINWAFYEILALWLSVLLMMLLFWRVRSSAGAMMIPYWLWVGFASVLNFAIWRANPA